MSIISKKKRKVLEKLYNDPTLNALAKKAARKLVKEVDQEFHGLLLTNIKDVTS